MIIHKDSHLDHCFTKPQMDWVVARFALREAFFIETVELPPALGEVPCSLYGPACGDPPVTDDSTWMQARFGRAWRSRLVDKPHRMTSKVTVVAGPHDGHACVLYTAYGGPAAPQEPTDPGCKDAGAAATFWATHALAEPRFMGNVDDDGKQAPIRVVFQQRLDALMEKHRALFMPTEADEDAIAVEIDALLGHGSLDEQSWAADRVQPELGDLGSALRENHVPLSEPVQRILLELTGEGDGPNWHWIVRLQGGRYAYITGGCDNTGWSCHSSASGYEADDLEGALREVGEVERAVFHEMIEARESCRASRSSW